MTLAVHRVGRGLEAEQWLDGELARLRGADPLAPVTVVVPTYYSGRAIRRRLAASGGYANLRTLLLRNLAEAAARPRLTGAGLLPLTAITEGAAIRLAARSGVGFGVQAEHRALVATLRSLFAEIGQQRLESSRLEDLARRSSLAEAAVDAYRRYRVILAERRLYDAVDAMAEAAKALAEGDANVFIAEAGPVTVWLPRGLTPLEAELIRALAGRTTVAVAFPWHDDAEADEEALTAIERLGATPADAPPPGSPTPPAFAPARTPSPAPSAVITAPDAGEELRSVVRKIVVELEAGTPLHRIAILFRNRDAYADLIEETLAAAGLPAFRLGGRPLADTLAGRALLGLLNLQRQQFSRPAVMTWLSSLPHHGDGPSLAQWDRISRDAGVLRGVEQWRHRLEHKLAEHRLTLEELQAQDAEEKLPRQRFLRGEIHAIEQMIRQISDMAERTRPRGEQSWSRLADWALQLRERFLRPAGLGSEDRDDIAAIDQVIESLRAAGSIDPEITVERFVETLEEALRAKRRNAGRPGDGVVTGLLADAAGMTFDAVFVVGMNERAFPSPPAIDPIFPFEAGEDPLGRSGRRLSRERAAYLAAIRSARRVVLSFATFDGESRPAYPSRWLLDEVESVAGESVGPSEMRTLAPSSKRPWLTAPPSAEAAVLEHGPVLNLAERRVREALLAFRARAPLSTIALARRDDLPLGRALEATGARRSTVFTAFDGNVKEVAAGSAALATPLSSLHPISASGVEDWAECPFRFFLARVLEVEGTKRPEDEEHWAVSAMDKGSLIHRVIERFMRELGDTGRPSPADEYNPADHARIEAIAREEFAELEQRGLTGYRLAWLNEQSAILQDLHTFLDKDAEFRRSAGWRPAHFEQRFGFEGDWPPATVTVPTGEQALLRGLIDRLDFGPAGAYITDYKTGGADVAADFAADPVVGGRKVQLAVYSLAVRRRFQETGEPAVPVTAAYWFISSKGGFRRIELTDSALSDRRLVEVVSVVKRALQEGAFPQVPGEEREIPRRPPWENCNYCDYNRICPTGRDQLRERKRNQPGADLHDGLLVGALGGEA